MNKKLKELRTMGLQESNSKLLELKNDIAKEQAVKATNTRPENPGKIKFMRRQVARILTIQAEKTRKGEVKP